jgi:3-(3-hydroxy-phenyl)propionate hydroxylase
LDLKLNGVYLSDLITHNFAILCFGKSFSTKIKTLLNFESAVDVITASLPSTFAEKYSAGPNTAYLIRPDLHIAARWHTNKPEDVIKAFHTVTYHQEINS